MFDRFSVLGQQRVGDVTDRVASWPSSVIVLYLNYTNLPALVSEKQRLDLCVYLWLIQQTVHISVSTQRGAQIADKLRNG